MKIALVTTEFYPFRGGGIGTYCESISRALVEKGHEVHVITSVPGPASVNGITVHRCSIPYFTPAQSTPGSSSRSELGLSDENYQASYCWAARIKEIVDEHGIDIIECQECMAPMYFYLYKRMFETDARYIPVISHLHTPNYEIALWDRRPMETPAMHMIRFMEDFTVCMSDAVLSPSHFLAGHVSKRLPEIIPRLNVIPYPAYERDVLLPEMMPAAGGREIVYVGRLEHRKGIETLVNALTRIMQSEPNLRVRFIGKSMYSHVRGMQYKDWVVETLSGFSDRVIFDGMLDRQQILTRMRAADCVIIPSIGENFPNVCIEAMQCGAVIIAADSGGMAEMIGAEQNGFLFEGSNVDSLVSMIKKVFAMPTSVLDATRRSAIERIRNYCDIDIIVEKRIKHYQHVLAEAENHKQSRIPAQLICGKDHKVGHSANSIGSVAAVVLNNGGGSLNETLNSLLLCKRKPDEILLLQYGTAPSASSNYQQSLSVPIKHLYMNSHELAELRNHAAKNTDTDAIFFIKNTETVHHDFIGKTVAIMDRYPEVAYVQPWIRSAKHSACPVLPFFPYFLYNNSFVTSSGMIRKRAFDDAGGYSVGLMHHYSDWQFVISLMSKGWISLIMDDYLLESKKYDYEQRNEKDIGIGSVMYGQFVDKNKYLFDQYSNELLGVLGSLYTRKSIYLNGNVSILEARLLREVLRKYRALRTVVENILAKIPGLKQIANK